MHRQILGMLDCDDNSVCVDHINGDRLDNRKANLRVVSLSLNSSNRHVVKSSTGFLGVSEKSGRFIARARRDGYSAYIGSFDTPEEARAAIEVFDETGNLSYPIKRPVPVFQYSLSGRLLGVYANCGEAGRLCGVSASSICRCVNGKRNTAGGFRWSYVPFHKEIATVVFGEDVGVCFCTEPVVYVQE